MIVILAIELVVIVLLVISGRIYRRRWLQEYEARVAIHRARILDNDVRSVDNERWAERVAQARKLGQEAVEYAAILERKRAAGATGEPSAEHIRNALGVLVNAPNVGHDNPDYNLPGWQTGELVAIEKTGLDLPLVVLEQKDYVAVKSRLWTAINALEGRE